MDICLLEWREPVAYRRKQFLSHPGSLILHLLGVIGVVVGFIAAVVLVGCLYISFFHPIHYPPNHRPFHYSWRVVDVLLVIFGAPIAVVTILFGLYEALLKPGPRVILMENGIKTLMGGYRQGRYIKFTAYEDIESCDVRRDSYKGGNVLVLTINLKQKSPLVPFRSFLGLRSLGRSPVTQIVIPEADYCFEGAMKILKDKVRINRNE